MYLAATGFTYSTYREIEMSKRVSNSKTKTNGKLHARQTVRLGWRKKKARAIMYELRGRIMAAEAGQPTVEA